MATWPVFTCGRGSKHRHTPTKESIIKLENETLALSNARHERDERTYMCLDVFSQEEIPNGSVNRVVSLQIFVIHTIDLAHSSGCGES
jgi:hypothetical protein